MQAVVERNGVFNVHYFTLQDILSVGEVLVVNEEVETLSLLVGGEIHPLLSVHQHFSSTELSLLLPLFEQYPHYCPYEMMLASFNYRVTTDDAVERCRRQLHEAIEDGAWDYTLRPMRNVMSRVRLKLRPFHLDIVSMLETGYVLTVRRMRAA